MSYHWRFTSLNIVQFSLDVCLLRTCLAGHYMEVFFINMFTDLN
jgi:hypothetical protein